MVLTTASIVTPEPVLAPAAAPAGTAAPVVAPVATPAPVLAPVTAPVATLAPVASPVAAPPVTPTVGTQERWSAFSQFVPEWEVYKAKLENGACDPREECRTDPACCDTSSTAVCGNGFCEEGEACGCGLRCCPRANKARRTIRRKRVNSTEGAPSEILSVGVLGGLS